MTSGIRPSLLRRALSAALAAALAFPTLNAAPEAAANQITFTFKGGGWGHGIGLSQWGARGWALQGKTYDWILKHYYQGTRLETKPPVTVRVNLDKDKAARTVWQIQAGIDTTLSVTQSSDATVRVDLYDSVNGVPAKYWITTAEGDTRLHEDDSGRPGEIIKAFDGGCYVTAGGLVRIVGQSGPFNHTGVRWRGRLHFIPETATKSKCVNRVDIESYLKGVVPRESPASFPAEALKAQAVAARSYAYDDAVNGRELWCTVWSQVYNGHSRPGHAHEATSTNAAVAATKGQVVWYGSENKPVKTFFFSSSGGHTANIEDVWLSSTPRPYYTGVKDADKDGNPHYAWSVGPLSTDEVSKKIRASVGTAAAAPAPHTITDMRLERADSGYTRYATVRWSNGATYRLRGDTVRRALGLKSTKFSVAITRPAPTVSRFQQTDAHIAFAGIWSQVAYADAYGGSYARTNSSRSEFVVRFEGTGIEWHGVKAPSLGLSEVELNGVVMAKVDLYSPKLAVRQKLFSATGLPQGKHLLVVRCLPAKNASSSGFGATLDRIDITDGTLLAAPAPVTRYEESGARVAELGGWSQVTTAAASGGTFSANARKGARIVVEFIGTRIDWIATKAPGYGTARVIVDGGEPVTVSLDATTTAYQRTVFSLGSLAPNRKHRMTIDVTGPSPSSAGTVTVDAFDVTGGWVVAPTLPVKRYQEYSASRKGRWQVYTNPLASGGKHIVSGEKGGSVSVRFEGTGIAWYGARTRWYGKAEVLLDGVKVATVDLYSPTVRLNRRIWSRTGLSAKSHTLTIRVLGAKRAEAASTLVSVDAFEIHGRLAP